MREQLSASAAAMCASARESGVWAAMFHGGGVAGHVLRFHGLTDAGLAALPVVTQVDEWVSRATALAGGGMVATDHLLSVAVADAQAALTAAGVDVAGLREELAARLDAVRGEDVSGEEMARLFGG